MTGKLAAVPVLCMAALVLVQAGSAAGPGVDQYVNNSEPAFLHDIGPQDVRSDNPLVAAVTALVVGLVFYRGFRKYRNLDDQSATTG